MDSLGIVNALYPMPTTLVGATVTGRPTERRGSSE